MYEPVVKKSDVVGEYPEPFYNFALAKLKVMKLSAAVVLKL